MHEMKQKQTLVLIAQVLALLCARSSLGEEPDTHPAPPALSIFQVIANPTNYVGRVVQISGYVVLSKHETALYPTKEFSDYRLIRNAIWLHLDKDLVVNDKKSTSRMSVHETKSLCNAKYVSILGVLAEPPPKSEDTLDEWPCMLTNIRFMALLPSRKEERKASNKPNGH